MIKLDELCNAHDLVINKIDIAHPELKKMTIEIPGMDSQLDLTEYFGRVNRKNRKISIRLLYGVYTETWKNSIESLVKEFDGEWIELTLDNEYFYRGRATCKEIREDGIYGVSLEIDAQPYRLRINKSVLTFAIQEEKHLTLLNEKMPTVPTITVDDDMRLEFEGISYSMGAGTHIVPEIVLKQGQNNIVCYGNGNITFEYQEGAI